MHVSKWGNSLAVRLPKKLVQELGLQEGDRIDLRAGDAGLTVVRMPGPAEVLGDLRRFRGTLPASQRLSRDDTHER